MNDLVFNMSGKLEKVYNRGIKEYKLSGREADIMDRNGKEVLQMLRDFDGIVCSYDFASGKVFFK